MKLEVAKQALPGPLSPREEGEGYVPPAIAWEQEFVALAFGSVGTDPCSNPENCGTPLCPSC